MLLDEVPMDRRHSFGLQVIPIASDMKSEAQHWTWQDQGL